jgi:formamidopyrimidine-DNA glycosylase
MIAHFSTKHVPVPHMPELPEVETTLRGIEPFVLKQKVQAFIIRHHGLRWPVPADLPQILPGQIIQRITRRGKYLLLETNIGTLIIHLGMSGSIRILTQQTPPKIHDHIDILFDNNICLRMTDPRRFGAVLWTEGDPFLHSLLAHLGPEPLENSFSGEYLWKLARKRKASVKTFLMDSKIVVGVGNIYATEALFEAGILPRKAAGKVSKVDYEKLAKAVRKILTAAIKKGGTTLKDFVNSDGGKGYFRLELKAYGRGGRPCLICKTTLKETRLGQRSTVFCPKCQK